MNRSGMNKYLLVAMSLFTVGCYEQKPPKGFEAVVPMAESQTRNGCPNLVDTYLVSSVQQFAKILNKPIPKQEFSYFIIDSLVGDQAYNYSLQMSSGQFIRKAQDLKLTAPEQYPLWREGTLQLRNSFSEEIFSQTVKYGPAYEYKGQFRGYGCADGWMKVQQTETRAWDEKAGRNYTQQTDILLARDKYGDLLIRTVSYRQKPGWTFWAAGGAGMTLVRTGDQWDKIRKAPDSTLTTVWSEVDLPTARKPVRNVSQCKLVNEIMDFNERLLQKGSIIEKFSFEPIFIKDGVCIQPPLQLVFSSANSKEGEVIMQSLKNDPIVDNLNLTETRYDNGRLRYMVQVIFRDLEAQ